MATVPRRTFLKTLGAGVAVSSLFPDLVAAGVSAAAPAAPLSSMPGLILVSSELGKKPRLDLISVRDGHILNTFHNLYVSHAIVTVEALNRFFFHGRDTRTGKGAIWGLEVNPATTRMAADLRAAARWRAGAPLANKSRSFLNSVQHD